MDKLKFTPIFLLLGLVTVCSYAQDNFNYTRDADSLKEETNVALTKTIYTLNNGADTLYLDPVGDNGINAFWGYEPSEIDLNLTNSTDTTATENDNSLLTNYVKKEIKIIDSLDLNGDGVKEVILLREWDCFLFNPVPQPYGIGDHHQSYSKYEVWDVKHKKMLFEVKNKAKGQVAISTNVIRSYGYDFKVEIDKKGSFYLFNSYNSEDKPEKHKYDKNTGTYEQVPN